MPDLETLTDYAEIIPLIGWPFVIALFIWKIGSPITIALIKRVNGNMEESDRGVLKGLSNDMTHDMKEIKRDVHELKQEQINQGKDIARLLTRVFNGK